IGSTKEEFDTYTEGVEMVYALILSEVKPYAYPIPLAQIEHLLSARLVVPQSYSINSNNFDWKAATSLAAILQGQHGGKQAIIKKAIGEGEYIKQYEIAGIG